MLIYMVNFRFIEIENGFRKAMEALVFNAFVSVG